ncbi:hypothetical protein MSG28_004915 [Choristoneura fumiferana]|uniref:Uncharacterized protein n=1 Tax=Choristoneura fumiferana TaxID=7141 RepID=A0ACC0JP75_CHOFU|nr:hypothetical protein MSG28_004915 [Choristoneura fumiferana]
MDRSFDLVALLKQQPTKTHKVKPSQFVSVAGGVQKRLETNIKNRKSSRLSIFDRIRNIPKESPRPPPISEVQLKGEHRKQQLEKWREEKDKKKKAAAAQKKKPFVAGVSHRNTFGPPSTAKTCAKSQALRQRSEQSKQPQSFAPSNAAFKPPQFKNTKVPTLAPVAKKKTNNKTKPALTFEPVLPKTTQNSRTRSKTVLNKPNLQTNKPDKVTLKPNEKTKGKLKNPSPKLRKSITRSIESAKSSDSGMTSSSSVSLEMSTPKNVPRSESSSEEKLRSPKSVASLTPEQIIEEVKNISPCVTMSRGKDNARREMKKKLAEGMLDEDNSNMDSVNHFRRQLDSEISRITGICEEWDKIFAQTVLPEPVQELVLTAVGQARLLMSQKMQQFAGLVERCARPPPGAALVTPADLAGFWDMLFMQVENVDIRFKKLQELRAREWTEEARPRPRPAPPGSRAPPPAPSPALPAGPAASGT